MSEPVCQHSLPACNHGNACKFAPEKYCFSNCCRGLDLASCASSLAKLIFFLGTKVLFLLHTNIFNSCHLNTQKFRLAVMEGSEEMFLLCPAPTPTILSVHWIAIGTSAKAPPSQVPLLPRLLLPIGDALRACPRVYPYLYEVKLLMNKID
jgi:hypothetical protein